MNQNTVLLLASAVAALIIIKAAHQQGAFEELGLSDPEDQTGSVLDYVPDFEDLTNYASDVLEEVDEVAANQNLNAVLWAIRKAEGTTGEEGFRALFGWRPGNGKVFNSFASHPRQFFNYTDGAGKTIRTSAAGAYQITATTFDALNRKYPGRFSGFHPLTQDQMAEALIAERGAMADIAAGRLTKAIEKIRPIWASLPGAGVNQPERSLAYITQAYLDAGGILA